jgi:hypothetical protein
MLQDRPVEFVRGNHRVTTNRDALDVDAALALLYGRLGFDTDTGGATYMERRPGRMSGVDIPLE